MIFEDERNEPSPEEIEEGERWQSLKELEDIENETNNI